MLMNSMHFTPTNIRNAFIIEIEKHSDERGFFSRAWCTREFEARNLNPSLVQANVVMSNKRGTLRGLHYQRAPWEEAKAFRCIKGSVFDVILDLRRDSPSYMQWLGVELHADEYRMLYVPEGCAHGYQALTDEAVALYHVSQFYSPESERGVRFDDPAFGVKWPIEPPIISQKDRSWPDYLSQNSVEQGLDTRRPAHDYY
jgi:dTDP-4-dehydrorhamnose 3,5-epimerase